MSNSQIAAVMAIGVAGFVFLLQGLVLSRHIVKPFGVPGSRTTVSLLWFQFVLIAAAVSVAAVLYAMWH